MAYQETRDIDEQGWLIRCAEAAALSHAGYTIHEIAQWFGKSEALMHYWGSVHPPFKEALRMHVGNADARVVNRLYAKALEGDTTAMIFWLKNRQPNDWRDKRDIDIGVPTDSEVEDVRHVAMALVHMLMAGISKAASQGPLVIEGAPNGQQAEDASRGAAAGEGDDGTEEERGDGAPAPAARDRAGSGGEDHRPDAGAGGDAFSIDW